MSRCAAPPSPGRRTSSRPGTLVIAAVLGTGGCAASGGAHATPGAEAAHTADSAEPAHAGHGAEAAHTGHGAEPAHAAHGAAPAQTAHTPLGHRFEHAEEWVAVFDDPARDAWQKPDEVVRLLALAPGQVVADLGAGTGYFEGRLSRAVGDGGRVLALDVEPDMVRHTAERARREGLGNVEARQVAVDDPGLAPRSVDRLLCVDTWHHVPERAAYARKLGAALRPGGVVVIVDFTMESPHGPPAHHRLRPEQVAADLEAGGLVARLLPEDLPEQFVVTGRLP